jgi:DNA-binding response OmpR family regulator
MQSQQSLAAGALKVLVAEDSEDDAVLLARAFRKAGAASPVHVCRDGQEMIDYLSGAEKFQDRNTYPWPSMLLLDLKMPRVSGFEVLEWLKRQQVEGLPAAVLSSSDHPKDMQRAYDLGACLYFVKPNVPEELTAMVRELIEKSGARAA